MPIEGAYPPPFYPDPLLSNVNFRPMPDDPDYFLGAPLDYDSPSELYVEVPPPVSDEASSDETSSGDAGDATPDNSGASEQSSEQPQQQQPQQQEPALDAPTDVTADALDDTRLRLSATPPPGQGVTKIVFYVDGKQAAVVDATTSGTATTTIVSTPGEHAVRAFAYTGSKSGPWSETVSVTV